MRKSFTILAVILLTASTLWAKTTKPPETTEENDLKYWTKAVASRVKVTGYAQAGYTATIPEEGKSTNTFYMKRAVLMFAANIAP